MYFVYTPNLGSGKIAVLGQEREQSRFKGSIEGSGGVHSPRDLIQFSHGLSGGNHTHYIPSSTFLIKPICPSFAFTTIINSRGPELAPAAETNRKCQNFLASSSLRRIYIIVIWYTFYYSALLKGAFEANKTAYRHEDVENLPKGRSSFPYHTFPSAAALDDHTERRDNTDGSCDVYLVPYKPSVMLISSKSICGWSVNRGRALPRYTAARDLPPKMRFLNVCRIYVPKRVWRNRGLSKKIPGTRFLAYPSRSHFLRIKSPDICTSSMQTKKKKLQLHSQDLTVQRSRWGAVLSLSSIFGSSHQISRHGDIWRRLWER